MLCLYFCRQIVAKTPIVFWKQIVTVRTRILLTECIWSCEFSRAVSNRPGNTFVFCVPCNATCWLISLLKYPLWCWRVKGTQVEVDVYLLVLPSSSASVVLIPHLLNDMYLLVPCLQIVSQIWPQPSKINSCYFCLVFWLTLFFICL